MKAVQGLRRIIRRKKSMNKKSHIPCLIMRGGTSKGVFFLENDLPADREERDRVLLNVMGSPDRKQLNGLGGATSVTSKAAIIGVSKRSDADVDYTFAQVSVDKPLVSYKGNCGNISAAVGPFAIERGLVRAREPLTTVRIHNVNTGKIIEEEVAVENGCVKYDGDYAIAGVEGTASPVKLKFLDPAGTVSDRLLPTGNSWDMLEVPGMERVKVSIVDAANPLVFVRAEDVGLKGTELPDELNGRPDILELLERIRGAAAVRMGLISDPGRSAWETPGIPKMTVVAPARSYMTAGGERVEKDQIDLTVRMMSMQKPHPTLAMTGAMCIAAAAVTEGSIVKEVMNAETDPLHIRIGHPDGIVEAGVEWENKEGQLKIRDTFGFRTANLLMEGNVYCC